MLALSAESEELAYISHPHTGTFRIVWHDDPPARVDPFLLQPGEVAFILSREIGVRLPMNLPTGKCSVRIHLRLLKPPSGATHPLLARIGTAYASSQRVFEARLSKLLTELLSPGIRRAISALSSGLPPAGETLPESVLGPLRQTAAAASIRAHLWFKPFPAKDFPPPHASK